MESVGTGIVGFAGVAVGALLTYWAKGDELKVRLVELAISIVREKPEQHLLPVREWAIDVINEHSKVKLSDDARKTLMRFPVFATGRADGAADVRGVSPSPPKRDP